MYKFAIVSPIMNIVVKWRTQVYQHKRQIYSDKWPCIWKIYVCNLICVCYPISSKSSRKLSKNTISFHGNNYDISRHYFWSIRIWMYTDFYGEISLLFVSSIISVTGRFVTNDGYLVVSYCPFLQFGQLNGLELSMYDFDKDNIGLIPMMTRFVLCWHSGKESNECSRAYSQSTKWRRWHERIHSCCMLRNKPTLHN